MPDITTTLTDEQFDAVAAGLPADAKSDQERVEAYFQSQHASISEQFVRAAKVSAFRDAGLAGAEKLADAGLDAEQELMLMQDAELKKS